MHPLHQDQLVLPRRQIAPHVPVYNASQVFESYIEHHKEIGSSSWFHRIVVQFWSTEAKSILESAWALVLAWPQLAVWWLLPL